MYVWVVWVQVSQDLDYLVQLLEYCKFCNVDYFGLSVILVEFLVDSLCLVYCVVVMVGYVCDDGMVIIVNVLWLLLVWQIECEVGLDQVYIVNDFEVVVYVVVQVDVSGVLQLIGLVMVLCGLILVVGFGMGFGVVVWIFILYGVVVLVIEVG